MKIIQPSTTISLEKNSRGLRDSSGHHIVPPAPPRPPENWEQRDLQTSESIIGVASDGNQFFIAVGTNGFASRSFDSGETWETLPQGIGMAITETFRCVDCSSEGVIVVGSGNNGATRSDDYGETWSEIDAGQFPGSDNFWFCATNGNGNWILGDSGQADIYYSSDDGLTWTFNDVTNMPEIRGGCFIRNTQNTFFPVGDDSTQFKTEDGGVNFESLPSQLGIGVSNLRDSSSILNTWVVQVAGNINNGISFDAGDNWQTVDPFFNSGNSGNQQFGAITSDNYSTFVSVQVNGYAAISTDSGLNFEALPRGLNTLDDTLTWNGIATNRKGVWIAVGETGNVSKGTP